MNLEEKKKEYQDYMNNLYMNCSIKTHELFVLGRVGGYGKNISVDINNMFDGLASAYNQKNANIFLMELNEKTKDSIFKKLEEYPNMFWNTPEGDDLIKDELRVVLRERNKSFVQDLKIIKCDDEYELLMDKIKNDFVQIKELFGTKIKTEIFMDSFREYAHNKLYIVAKEKDLVRSDFLQFSNMLIGTLKLYEDQAIGNKKDNVYLYQLTSMGVDDVLRGMDADEKRNKKTTTLKMK